MTIETKFNIGQEVFYVEHGIVISGIISHITIEARKAVDNLLNINAFVKIIYKINDKTLTDIECFATPQDLLKHIEKQLPNAKL